MKLIPGHLYLDKGDNLTRMYIGRYIIIPRKTVVERYYLFGTFYEGMNRPAFWHYPKSTISMLSTADTAGPLSKFLHMLGESHDVIGDSMIITTMVDISPAEVKVRV